MATIRLHQMKFFAHHGCFVEEAVIGTHFTVDLMMIINTRKAQESDLLTDTVDYQSVYQSIKKQMHVRSNLLENVAHRILLCLKEEFPQIEQAEITIQKINPPLGQSELSGVSVTLSSDDVL